ncbi:hypothetical protein B0H14DRAFT_2610290 [Mycena olivaceomarginata]|nr:hypothetical protein B0H14DRAFT_2610290 [Mycena olivaceomarginata]
MGCERRVESSSIPAREARDTAQDWIGLIRLVDTVQPGCERGPEARVAVDLCGTARSGSMAALTLVQIMFLGVWSGGAGGGLKGPNEGRVGRKSFPSREPKRRIGWIREPKQRLRTGCAEERRYKGVDLMERHVQTRTYVEWERPSARWEAVAEELWGLREKRRGDGALEKREPGKGVARKMRKRWTERRRERERGRERLTPRTKEGRFRPCRTYSIKEGFQFKTKTKYLSLRSTLTSSGYAPHSYAYGSSSLCGCGARQVGEGKGAWGRRREIVHGGIAARVGQSGSKPARKEIA